VEDPELVRANNLMERADLMLSNLFLIKECHSTARGEQAPLVLKVQATFLRLLRRSAGR